MRKRVTKLVSTFVSFVLALLLICSVSFAPVHAASMVYGDAMDMTEPAAPCPMMMQIHGDHGSEDDGAVSSPMGDMSCCMVQAVVGARRDIAPIRFAVLVALETLSDARSSLSDPGVDPQPPRG